MADRNSNKYSDLSENKLSNYIVWIAIAVIVAALGIFLYQNMHVKEASDTERGLAKLQELEAIDVAETEKTIRELRGQTTGDEMTANADLTTDLKGEFLDASILVAGDSAAQLLLDYDVLDDSVVIATLGSGVLTCSGDINTAIALAPENLVLVYGLDDLVYFEGDTDEFIEGYEAVLQSVKEGLPKAKIYVCEITEAASDALDSQPEYGSASEFNAKLRKLCISMNVNYIETSDLVSEYGTDGIHPAYSYYVSFAQRILRTVTGSDGTSSDSAAADSVSGTSGSTGSTDQDGEYISDDPDEYDSGDGEDLYE